MVVDQDPHVATEIEATGDILKPKDIEDPEFESEDSETERLEKKQKPEGTEEEEEEDETLYPNMRELLVKAILACSAILLVAYLLAAFIIDFQRAIALFICTILTIAWHIWVYWAQQNEETVQSWEDNTLAFFVKTDTEWKYGLAVGGLLCLIMIIMMAVTVRDARNLISLLGLFAFIALTWLFSWKPTKVKLRPVIGAIFMQFVLGYIVIRTSWGLTAMQFLADIITTLLGYTTAGSGFVFNWLTDGSLFGRPFQLVNEEEGYFLGPPFFFNVLPTVIFFSALMSVGYYIRVLPWCVRKFGYFVAILLGTSASESLSAVGNIFVGQTEAPLLVRPFIATMTESELHAIMAGGMATIAGSVFGIYVSFGVDPVAILAASIMSAPAALAISKIAYPETEESTTSTGKRGAYDIPISDDVNVVHAASNGAVIGTQLMLNIAGNLIAFLAIIQMLDSLLIYLGDRVDISLSFNIVCQYLFWPFAWLMGVDTDDCEEVAILIGLKIFANEFVAYARLTSPDVVNKLTARSFYIASYALCGFSNFGSIGIMLGGLTPMAPAQGPKLAKLVFSAMVAGNTACLMTACIAGIFYEEPGS